MAGGTTSRFGGQSREHQDVVTQDRPQAVIQATSGGNVFICVAEPGTAAATAEWQCKKVDSSGSVTWADGNADFDNAATDPASLSYS